MPQTKVKKTFDCIAFKEEAQRRIYEEIKDMTSQEQIEYFHRKAMTGPFAKWWKKVRKASES